ncbi:hypothetical protein E2C01_077177 [Portunus trituberculatus]|uniref:Uncharacterized protein n=1 Tax=Portunus trituberculatus TaxID=210409 RepID=A0A5B7IL51_PORTR|nr:hypothetical protein [Portunus trituberculatus]
MESRSPPQLAEEADTHHMWGELPVIVPEGDDPSLTGLRGLVGHFSGSEVEVPIFLRPHHHCMRHIGIGGDPVKLDLQLSPAYLKVLRAVEGCCVSSPCISSL